MKNIFIKIVIPCLFLTTIYSCTSYVDDSNVDPDLLLDSDAKNLFLSSKKTPWRKIEEAFITLMIENVMSKRRILEIYLNVIEWGNGVFGAEAAIRHYYGGSTSSVTAEQAARLAAMVPNPRFYDRNRSTPWLLKKTDIILSRMASTQIP